MAPGELLTVQLGPRSNFVGSHFWNLQDELLGLQGDPNWPSLESYLYDGALFSQGEKADGTPTYTPRVLIVDARGAAGSWSVQGELAGPRGAVAHPDAAPAAPWGGATRTTRQDPVPESHFQRELRDWDATGADTAGAGPAAETHADGASRLEAAAARLESDARYYTDFLKTYLHPKSIFEVPGIWAGAGSIEFRGFGAGLQLASAADVRDEIDDRLRHLAEECDHLQGFQIMVDSGGWEGLASAIVPDIADDYGPKPVLLFSMRDSAADAAASHAGALDAHPDYEGDDGDPYARIRQLSEGMALHRLSGCVGGYVPVDLSLAGVGGPDDAAGAGWPLYASSALVASALDAVTSPCRAGGGAGAADAYWPESLGAPVGAVSLPDMLRTVSGQRGPVACLSASLPAARVGPGVLHAGARGLMGGLKGGVLGKGVRGEWVVARGVRTRGASVSYARADVVEDAVARDMQGEGVPHVAGMTSLPVPSLLPVTFPARLLERLGAEGACYGECKAPGCAVLTRLQSGTEVAGWVRGRREALRRAAGGAGGKALLASWGCEEDDVLQATEELEEHANMYEDEMH
ncbi:unnamed protein product [Pedinophyceae sp. YPF-701]|nr:unnamed protein product [Pedinophyceae sp. YPF-701]